MNSKQDGDHFERVSWTEVQTDDMDWMAFKQKPQQAWGPFDKQIGGQAGIGLQLLKKA